MKLQIFKEEYCPAYLQLEERQDGGIDVVAVRSDGHKIIGGNLVQFTSKGYVSMYAKVNPDLGFNLDEDGCINFNAPILIKG